MKIIISVHSDTSSHPVYDATCSISTEVENLIEALALNGVGSDPMDKED